MPSPDLSQYEDLVLDDRTAQQIFDVAHADLTSRGAKIDETHLATWLLEAFALTVEEVIYWIRQLPAGVAEVLMRRFDVVRSSGLPPTVTVTFTAADNAGHQLPGGLHVALPVADGDPIVFVTDGPTAIAAGAFTSAPVTATAQALTDAVNGTAAGTALILLDALGYIDRVQTTTAVAGGAGPESDQAYRDRGLQRIRRLSAVLLHPEQFESFALERPEVDRARGVNNFDPAQAGAPGAHGGHITLAVLGPASALLTAAQRAAIAADTVGVKAANLRLHVVDPTVTGVDVSTTFVPRPGHDPLVVDAAVTSALETFLASSTWQWEAVVRRNDLIALVEGVPGVDHVPAGQPAVPAGDVALPGVAPLTRPGTIAVTAV